MKIGILTGLWFIAENADIFESLKRVANLGFKYVDLHGTFHAGPIHLTQDDRVKVKRELDRLGLHARNLVLHAPHNIAAATDSELDECFEYLKDGVQTCLLWGVNQLMLNAGLWSFQYSREDAWSRSVRFLQRICDFAAQHDVYIAQEAEPYVWFLVNDIESTVRMKTAVNRQNFSTLVDLGHMALARESPGELLHLGGSIIHVHISDHKVEKHTNQIVGTGNTPIADYLQFLLDMNIDQHVHRFGYDEIVASFELGFPGDQILNADDWVLQSIEYLRQIAPYITLA
jgi:sugar phosphate isomerase/epimerase